MSAPPTTPAKYGGDDRLQQKPDVPVFTGAIDRELDENGYIRPGPGDTGDRFYGTR